VFIIKSLILLEKELTTLRISEKCEKSCNIDISKLEKINKTIPLKKE
jgi:hypothetical protein